MSSSIAASYAAFQAQATQSTLATTFAKQNAAADQAVAGMLEAVVRNLDAIVAETPPGVGDTVDVTV